MTAEARVGALPCQRSLCISELRYSISSLYWEHQGAAVGDDSAASSPPPSICGAGFAMTLNRIVPQQLLKLLEVPLHLSYHGWWVPAKLDINQGRLQTPCTLWHYTLNLFTQLPRSADQDIDLLSWKRDIRLYHSSSCYTQQPYIAGCGGQLCTQLKYSVQNSSISLSWAVVMGVLLLDQFEESYRLGCHLWGGWGDGTFSSVWSCTCERPPISATIAHHFNTSFLNASTWCKRVM